MLNGGVSVRSKNINELAKNPNLILGIHNYCDRWCERCSYTSRCLVYATEEADSDDDPASRDISNAAFWQKLGEIFRETHEMVLAWANENGVDLTSHELSAELEQNERRRAEVRKHPLAGAAERYTWDVDAWFMQRSQALEVFSDTGILDHTADDTDVSDYVEVIRWYQFLIAVKLVRGLQSRVDEGEYIDKEESRDSDGSVKVALLAIDRSLSAWRLIRESLGDDLDSIKRLLLGLEQLRLLAEKEFPAARGFIRPGFDEDLDKLH